MSVAEEQRTHEEQNDNFKIMECVKFTQEFNHKNCLTKCFIATDGFVLIPVTKIFGEKHRHDEKYRNIVRS
jgi:hypothetical protein